MCIAELPCSAPAKGVRITFARSSETHSVRTDSRGRYRVVLAPGTWTIRIEAGRFGYRPRTVVVPTARVGIRNIQIDTGIR